MLKFTIINYASLGSTLDLGPNYDNFLSFKMLHGLHTKLNGINDMFRSYFEWYMLGIRCPDSGTCAQLAKE